MSRKAGHQAGKRRFFKQVGLAPQRRHFDNGVFYQAHSTPLEIAAELGLPLAGLMRRRRDAVYPIAATGVGLLGRLHSLVDFPLQLPGFAIVFTAGLGLAQSLSSKRAASAEAQAPPATVNAVPAPGNAWRWRTRRRSARRPRRLPIGLFRYLTAIPV